MNDSLTTISQAIDGMPSVHETMLLTFSWYDYVLFAFILLSSVVIGLYFGCTGNKQSTACEYLLGSKQMTALPVALSLVACHVSGVTILASPADIYIYGATYCLSLISIFFVGFINYYVYLPVFYNLQITSIYEYIAMRFNTKLRLLASLLNTIAICMFLPLVIYVPALAFSQSTSINIHFLTPTICVICIFYTTIGGLKAVIWTDALQFVSMIGAILAVVYVGIVGSGGFHNIYDVLYESGRLDFSFDISPFVRDTVWSVIIGLGFSWLNIVCISQSVIQKFLSLPSLKEVKKALIVFVAGELIIKILIMFTGLVMVTRYYHCDPLQLGIVKKRDAMLPHFIIDITGKIKGLPGLFMAGILSASLSTLSAYLNCIAGTVYEDFIKRYMPNNIEEKTVSIILKLLVIGFGIIIVALVFVVERLGGILPLAIGIGGASGGPLFGLFSLGVLVPKANSKGAMVGTVTSMIVMLWILIGSHYHKSLGYLKAEPKALLIDGCDAFNITINSTLSSTATPKYSDEHEVFFLYRITHYYYSMIGTFIVLIVGVPVSLFTRNKEDKLKKTNKCLLSPVVNWTLDDDDDSEELNYHDVKKAIQMLEIHDETN